MLKITEFVMAFSPIGIASLMATMVDVYKRQALGLLIILSLVLTMWIRSRKREMGILSSLGIKRQAILVQFVLESCMVAVACLLYTSV